MSADRPFSEPIMQEYERRSGVRVNVVYDTEETKSTAWPIGCWRRRTVRRPTCSGRTSRCERSSEVARRARAVPVAGVRRASPRCSWIPRATGPASPRGYRVIVYNTDKVKAERGAAIGVRSGGPALERAGRDCRSAVWLDVLSRRRALRASSATSEQDDYFRRLKANDVKIVDGNSVVRDMVARGDVMVGLTDTDDVNVAMKAKQPVAMVLPDRDGIGVPVMPNMVSLDRAARRIPTREDS